MQVGFKRYLLVFFIALPVLLILSQLGQGLNVVNNLPLTSQNLSFDIEYRIYEDESGQKSVNEIAANLDAFKELEINKAPTNFGEQAYWYFISIKNVKSTSRNLTLLFDNSMLDKIDVYQNFDLPLDRSKPLTPVKLGDLQATSLEQLALPNVALSFDSGETEKILVRTVTNGAPNLPISFFLNDSFERYKNVIYIIWGAFIGIVILMTIYNLILFWGVKDVLYLLYVGYVLCSLIVMSVTYGFVFYLMPYWLASLVSEYIIFFYYVLAYLLLALSMYFLGFNATPQKLMVKVVKGMFVLLAAMSVTTFFQVEYKSAEIFFALQGITYILCLAMVINALKNRVKWVNFYVISWLPLFAGAAIGPMVLTGNLDYSFWTRHALLFGMMFEMCFISMALAERLRISEKQRLFEASHDPIFGFCNSIVLQQQAKALIQSEKSSNFSIVAVEIRKYEQISPYLSDESQKLFMSMLAEKIESFFSNQLAVVSLDEKVSFAYTAMIREGVFGYLVSSNDRALLNRALSELMSSQPVHCELDNININVNLTVGSASYFEQADEHDILNRALLAIEIAKGKNLGVWLYDDKTRSEEGKKVQIASDLQGAIRDSKLTLYHQPQVDLTTGKVFGSEVLLRWNHPTYGFIPPDTFVAIAENTGLINKLTEWVFEEACKHLLVIQRSHSKDYRLSINLSAYDVMQEQLISFLLKILNKYNLKAVNFTLEVTETVSITNVDVFKSNLLELKELGFHIAMDDFGTGYSSLTYVSQHPFDEIKIDRGFVRDVASSQKDQTIVAATINMSKSLGLKIVAEGIENEDAVNILQQLKCDIGQGYYYSRPLPLDDYLKWFNEQ